MHKQKKLFCFGFGYTAHQLARELLAEGFTIAGTTREFERRDELRQKGVESYIFDTGYPLTSPEKALKDVTHILISVPPDTQGDHVAFLHGNDLAFAENLEWVGYLSATSVYGNHDGEWVTEKTEVNPGSIRGSRRERAEKQWTDLWIRHALPLHTFRLAGIYGPGRSAIDTVQAGSARRIDKPGQVFSRIHIDDIAQVLKASILKPSPGAIYNVADDLPAASHEVIAYACELLQIEPLPLIPWDEASLSPIAASFYRENKKISNKKIKEDLGISLRFPDYKAGLDHIFEQSKQSGYPFLYDDI